MNQTSAYASRFGNLSRGDLRRRRRDRRARQARARQAQEKQQPVYQVKLTAEESRRMVERKEYVDAAVALLSNYSWSYFITLTFRESLGPEAIERAIKRFTRFIHENIFGEFDAIRDVRDLYGVRYFPAIERGKNGTRRLHAHLMICGGEILGERLMNAKWLPWMQWWNKNYGGMDPPQKPESQGDVAAYCTKYILKGDDASFELCSTWADERDRRARASAPAPLIKERKIGIDVTISAEVEKNRYRGETPRGTGPTSKGSGKPCRRCHLVSGCQCWEDGRMKTCLCGRISMGRECEHCRRCSECCTCGARNGPVKLVYHNAKFGQVVDAPEPNAGACEGGDGRETSSPPSPQPQLELRMQQQMVLPMHASANKSVRFSSRREKKLHRWSEWKLRKARQVLSSSAACNVSSGN